MDRLEFYRHEFVALRAEIQSRQNRMFWTVIIGLLGMPVLSYLAMGAGTVMSPVLPLFVLVVIVLFLAEQNAMMRAGRYIRENIERLNGADPGWETWLESRMEYRLMEKHFSACFITIFFVFYFVSIAVSASNLWIRAVGDDSGYYWTWFYGAVGVYLLSTLWVLATLVHHWKSSVSTAVDLPAGAAEPA